MTATATARPAWWRVYDAKGQYVAVVKHAEDAAALVVRHGDSATIRTGPKGIVWVEGAEVMPATLPWGPPADPLEFRIGLIARTIAQRASNDLPVKGKVGCMIEEAMIGKLRAELPPPKED